MNKALIKIFWAIFILLTLISALGLLGDKFEFFDNINHFRPQLFLFSLFMVLIALMTKIKSFITAFSLLCILNFSFVMSAFYLPVQPFSLFPLHSSYIFLSVNIKKNTASHNKFLRLIDNLKPDVIFVIEANNDWLNNMSLYLNPKYPYYIKSPREDDYGVALFSRHPFSGNTAYFTENMIPFIDIIFNEIPLRFIGFHGIPPTNHKNFNSRNKQMKQIANLAKNEKLPLIVMGDFDDTPWTYNFLSFLKKSGLKVANEKWGFLKTWPTFFYPLSVQIDNALIKNIPHGYLQTHEDIGSDHYPISFQILE
jgi:endonuclease/exonuclease/phosphatase (EEP) superfamily protein YafD